jgi:hypothetical protein
LMLAQSEGMEPQNFLQLAHGQPLLWQLGVSTFSGLQSPRLPYAVIPISCRSPFRTTTVKRSASVRNTDRHHFGIVIDISSER